MLDFLDLMGQAELSERSEGPAPSRLVRLRQSHHLLARKLAEGASVEAASALTGYAPGTIRALQVDPAFQELKAFYAAQVEQFVASIEDRIGAMCGSFLDELQHRLEEAPEKFSNKELLMAFELLGDRSVAPSKSKVGQVGGPAGVAVQINFVPSPSASPLLELSPEPSA